MTKKKKKKVEKKSSSAFSRFYPKVEKVGAKKRSEKNESIHEKSKLDEGNQSPEENE